MFTLHDCGGVTGGAGFDGVAVLVLFDLLFVVELFVCVLPTLLLPPLDETPPNVLSVDVIGLLWSVPASSWHWSVVLPVASQSSCWRRSLLIMEKFCV